MLGGDLNWLSWVRTIVTELHSKRVARESWAGKFVLARVTHQPPDHSGLPAWTIFDGSMDSEHCLWQTTQVRNFVRDRVNPVLLRHAKVGIAPHTRWLAGQRAFLFQELGITTVLDVGANTGQYGLRLRRAGFRGTIHSFEPGAAALSQLRVQAAGDARWHVHGQALGAETGSAEFQNWVGAGSEAASLRQPSDAMLAMLGPAIVEVVAVVTLADWLADHPALDIGQTWLKVDVQGSEREVLRGAGLRLPAFPAIEIEATLANLYRGEASLGELLSELKQANFVPCSIMTERFHTGWRGAADVDVVAIRQDLSRVPSFRDHA